MTRIYPPQVNSAPLPPDHGMEPPPRERVDSELDRAAIELVYALSRHREAWAKMRMLKELADKQGHGWYMDNSRRWKLATGDVTWWRGEISAQSNALQALALYLDRRDGGRARGRRD